MSLNRLNYRLLAGALACMAVPAAPLAAQTFEYIDALSDASANEATGIATARDQAGRGEYLDALATLERVMAAFPESHEAKLLHAVFLCRIDDNQGGLVEMDQLKESDYGAQLLAEARSECAGG